MIGLDAVVAAMLGYPALAGLVAAGSLAVLWAVIAAQGSFHGRTGWLAAVATIVLSA